MDGKMLEHVDFFRGIAPNALNVIAGAGSKREYFPDTVIFSEGEAPDSLFGLLEGVVELSILFTERLFKTDELRYEEAIRSGFEENEIQIVVDEINPGEIFGWSALAGIEKRTATARSTGPVQAFEIPALELRRLFGEDPILGFTLMERLNKVIASRLDERTQRLVESWTEAFGTSKI
ncbi:MAG TPA: cyclic nucleotide-binding domain-containing protein [Desulfobacteraceae bacterium]|mgnify:CR=1 FL=1|nr:cyclic nucleotide-binding domain-containing protein [Desulfobacteraceae bacterium]